DGTIQMCHDLRGKKEWILCRHDDPEEILKVWGSKKHLDLIKSIDPNKCPRCFIGITPVMTNLGLKSIENVEKGNFVQTHNGCFKEVVDCYERDYEGEGYKIKVYGNRDEIICTKEHPFLTITPKTCFYKNRSLNCLPGCNYLKYRKRQGCKDKCPEYHKDYKYIWKSAKELKLGDFLCIPKYKSTKEVDYIKVSDFVDGYEIKGDYIFAPGGREDQRKYVSNKIPLAEFLKLGGYYLAEGYGKKSIRFSFNKKEKVYID
ncbi:unnamed protein product, partial [marine sediment metagenome]